MSLLDNRVRRGFYLDSVALMRISMSVAALEGVEAAALMIGTPANKALLAQSGLLDAQGEDASPNDLIVAVRAADPPALARASDRAHALLDHPPAAQTSSSLPRARRLATALGQLDAANLALVSVPGAFAAHEARQALQAGLHVIVFSDNVDIADEIALKRLAGSRGLLMMGPDCGTCLIGGVPIAFANAVPRGALGIVSASGTGLQEVSTLVARAGKGIAHGIGVGGRDLSESVAGASTLAALEALDRDPQVERIVLISKPPARTVVDRLLARIGASSKPFVLCFLGCEALALPPNAVLASTLRAAAEHCIGGALAPDWVASTLRDERVGGSIRGLFCGGTLCAEAQAIAIGAGAPVCSNAPVPGAKHAREAVRGAHLMLDLGDDDYTRGRPHPMIEPEIRSEPIARALSDPQVGVLLLDVVIGYGAHPDPAGVLAAALARCGAYRARIVASVTGTEHDPQRYSLQCRTLERSGVVVAPSNAHAAELAVRLAASHRAA